MCADSEKILVCSSCVTWQLMCADSKKILFCSSCVTSCKLFCLLSMASDSVFIDSIVAGCRLLYHVVWCLVLVSADDELSNDIRQMGGIPLLLALLQ